MPTLEQVFAEIKPYSRYPKKQERDLMDEFVRFLGLKKGKLYHSDDALVWAFGNLEDPEWLKTRGFKRNECTITTEPGTPYMFLGHLLLFWPDEVKGQKNWLYWLKFTVSDRYIYFPLSPDMRMPGVAEYMKEMFNESTIQVLGPASS